VHHRAGAAAVASGAGVRRAIPRRQRDCHGRRPNQRLPAAGAAGPAARDGVDRKYAPSLARPSSASCSHGDRRTSGRAALSPAAARLLGRQPARYQDDCATRRSFGVKREHDDPDLRCI
jgi:hypothetical protein